MNYSFVEDLSDFFFLSFNTFFGFATTGGSGSGSFFVLLFVGICFWYIITDLRKEWDPCLRFWRDFLDLALEAFFPSFVPLHFLLNPKTRSSPILSRCTTWWILRGGLPKFCHVALPFASLEAAFPNFVSLHFLLYPERPSSPILPRRTSFCILRLSSPILFRCISFCIPRSSLPQFCPVAWVLMACNLAKFCPVAWVLIAGNLAKFCPVAWVLMAGNLVPGVILIAPSSDQIAPCTILCFQ